VAALARAIVKASEQEIALCPLVRAASYRSLAEGQVGWDESISTALLDVFRNCSENWDDSGFYGESTVAQILHILAGYGRRRRLFPGKIWVGELSIRTCGAMFSLGRGSSPGHARSIKATSNGR